jgi:hypothetical protein
MYGEKIYIIGGFKITDDSIQQLAEAMVLGWRRDDGHYYGLKWSEEKFQSEVTRVARQLRENAS